MRKIIILLFFLSSNLIHGQYSMGIDDKNQIILVLKKQEKDWNEGDIDRFMKGYLNSDELVFNSSKGPFFGFKSVKERYKDAYPTGDQMGKLKLEILKISGITKHVAYLIGKYILIYPEKEDLGFFTLTFVKSNNEWLILSDHTSKISNPK